MLCKKCNEKLTKEDIVSVLKPGIFVKLNDDYWSGDLGIISQTKEGDLVIHYLGKKQEHCGWDRVGLNSEFVDYIVFAGWFPSKAAVMAFLDTSYYGNKIEIVYEKK